MDIILELIKNKTVSWETIYFGFLQGLLVKKDIENFAINFLKNTNKVDINVISLADASLLNEIDIKEHMLNLFDINKINKNEEKEKLQLAILNLLMQSKTSDETKCNNLQEIYAKFDYPQNMRDCSIYFKSNISPLYAMQNLIKKLKAKYQINE